VGVRVVVGKHGGIVRCDGRDRGSDVPNGAGEAIELAVIEPAQHPTHEIVTQDLDVRENLPSLVADTDEHDTAVVRMTKPLHEAALLHPVDEARGVGIGHVEQLRDPAHRQVAVAIKHRHHVEVAHREAVPDEPFARDATKLAERRPKLAHDGVDRAGAVLARNSSCHADYSTEPDHAVNPEDLVEREERMRFALMIEPQQGLSYAEQLAIARAAEAAGFEALFRSDHYESFPGPADRPTTDAWAVLAGLARETSRIRLGTLVSPVTFRLPGNFAKVVATVDEMSGGRVEVGLGAGWHEDEHRRHGLPFPPIEQRAEMLEEQLQILHGFWDEPDGWSLEGRHYTVADARIRARPSPRPRILVGGGGTPRGMRIAARWADEFNLSSSSAELAKSKFAALDEACRAAGREPASLSRSVMAGVLVGSDAREVERRERALREALGGDAGDDWLEERRRRWVYGTPDDARAMVAAFADAGVERMMLQDFVPRDLDMIALLGRELVARG
jgi:F420-dependent oxidoreductase-like protein